MLLGVRKHDIRDEADGRHRSLDVEHNAGRQAEGRWATTMSVMLKWYRTVSVVIVTGSVLVKGTTGYRN